MLEGMYELMCQKQQEEITRISDCNEMTRRFALELNTEEVKELIESRNDSLKKYQRVELGKGILDKLVFTFCDSQYIQQEDYLELLTELQDVFYQLKNDTLDKVSDDELMTFMKEQFEEICCGDMVYLKDTCLERFSAAVRNGYEGYSKTGGRGEYQQLSQEKRWDVELYQEVLKELFW